MGADGSAAEVSRRGWSAGRIAALVAAVLVGLVAVLALVVVAGIWQRGKDEEVPQFASLVEDPDPSITGGIAMLDGKTDPCVAVRAASGEWRNEDLQWCAPGRTLRWTDDGKLEHLAYSNDTAKGRPQEPGQRAGGTPVSGQLIDVGTGAVTPVDTADMPASPPESPDPAQGPGGRRAVATADDGHVEVMVEGPEGSRTVMSADGGSLYTVTVEGWAPDGSWLLLSDSGSRYLVVTLGEDPRTRMLDDNAIGEPGAVAITGSEPWATGD